jgi:hypothetical protein
MTENLDIMCAEVGRSLAGISGLEEKHLTNALGVLEEQGLYAFFLYLKARVTGKGRSAKPGEEIVKKCSDFLRERFPEHFSANEEVFEGVRQLDLDNLLFARDLLGRIMVYALYHMKAQGDQR